MKAGTKAATVVSRMNSRQGSLAVALVCIFVTVLACTPSSMQRSPESQQMDSLLVAWRTADGGDVEEIEFQLMEALKAFPNAFYPAMAKDTKSYRSFLYALYLEYLYVSEDTVWLPAENDRQETMRLIRAAEINKKYEAMRQEILDSLQAIDVRKLNLGP